MSDSKTRRPGARLRAVVFDWGGTITPWDDGEWEPRWEDAARFLTPDATVAAVDALVQAEKDIWSNWRATGQVASILDVPGIAAGRLGLEPSDQVVAEMLTLHRRHLAPLVHARPEARPTLLALRQRGLATGLLTMSHWPREWHDELFRDDGIADLFDVCYLGADVKRSKPHPDSFLAVLGELGVAPQESVFVGDNPQADIYGAQAVGMATIWLPNGTLTADGIEADAVISNLSEVVTVVDGWQDQAPGRGPETARRPSGDIR
jgi:HAD superfamily hydrolase (TIGR01509 family)